MGVILMFILAFIFGWAFTEQNKRQCEQLQSQLEDKQKELERLAEQHAFEKQIWKNTVKELLGEL